jgi:hypothetical protein
LVDLDHALQRLALGIDQGSRDDEVRRRL